MVHKRKHQHWVFSSLFLFGPKEVFTLQLSVCNSLSEGHAVRKLGTHIHKMLPEGSVLSQFWPFYILFNDNFHPFMQSSSSFKALPWISPLLGHFMQSSLAFESKFSAFRQFFGLLSNLFHPFNLFRPFSRYISAFSLIPASLILKNAC